MGLLWCDSQTPPGIYNIGGGEERRGGREERERER